MAGTSILLLILFASLSASAQTPRISALFPAGARAGETVEVAVRGGSLVGAKRLMVMGAPGVTAELVGGNAAVDETVKPLFQAKCTNCHEARSPANRTMSPEQWASTVDRMISARGAEIPKPDRDRIVGYLQALAKAGEISAKITVAKDAVPGFREVRLLTDHGASTAFNFEVGGLPEVAAQPKTTHGQPQKLTLPVVVNGTLAAAGQRDWFSFEAKKGQRLTFNLKGFRLNEQSQAYFNPVLYIYDAAGKEVTKSLGRYGLDPVIDWTAPADGTYTLLAHDMIWHGTPASIYRLAIGPLPYDAVLNPVTARPGALLSARMVGSVESSIGAFDLKAPEGASGVTMVATPLGDAALLVRDLPDGGDTKVAGGATAAALPAMFRGVITTAAQTDTFRVKVVHGGSALEIYARRLGSPLLAKVVVKNAKGDAVRQGTATNDDDFRLDNAFPQPGEYTVEVSSADGNASPSSVYCWEALDGTPDFSLTATPDGLNLSPGGMLPLIVQATRRENVKGPITISISGLPDGVTASPAIITPDTDRTIVVLSASPTASIAGHVVRIEGSAEGVNGGTAVRRAQPLEMFRINNNPRPFPRGAAVMAVGSDVPPFTLSLADGSTRIAMAPNEETKVTIHIERKGGFKGDVYVFFPTVPPGIGVQNAVNIPPDKTEGVITLRANGDARFFKKDQGDMPARVVIFGNTAANGDNPAGCTPPLLLVPK